jgi:hypothetical protein
LVRLRDILSTPWILTDKQRKDIDDRHHQDNMRALEDAEKRKLREFRHAEKKQKSQKKLEKKRKHEEDKLNNGALPGSSTILQPWD